jgi:hypothetical protein
VELLANPKPKSVNWKITGEDAFLSATDFAQAEVFIDLSFYGQIIYSPFKIFV